MCRGDGTQKFTYGDLDWGLCVASSEHLVGGEVRTVLWGTAMNEREAKTLQCGCSLSSSSVVFGPPFGENVTRVVVRTEPALVSGQALSKGAFFWKVFQLFSQKISGEIEAGMVVPAMVWYHTILWWYVHRSVP